MEDAATGRSSRLRPLKSCQRRFRCSNVQSLKLLAIKINGLLIFFRRNWEAALDKKFPLLEPGSVCRGDYVVHRVQTRLEESLFLEDLLDKHSLSFVLEVANKTGE